MAPRHPLGLGGARLPATLVCQMMRARARRGIATLGAAVGQGVATLVAGA